MFAIFYLEQVIRLKVNFVMIQNFVLCKTHECIATLTLNRPEKLNALNPELLVQLIQTMTVLEEQEEVRVVIIRGAGDKAFTAGFDVTQFPTVFPQGDLENLKNRITHHPVIKATDAVARFPYPVIAMINGYAFGAGLGLAMACDIRVATDTATFAMPPAKIGLVYHPQGLKHFINAVGIANAKEIFLLGRSFNAYRAKEMGLIHYIVPKEQLEEFSLELAQEISENAPLALRGMKSVITHIGNNTQHSSEEDEWITELVAKSYNSKDLLEGLSARKKKRKPNFQGK